MALHCLDNRSTGPRLRDRRLPMCWGRRIVADAALPTKGNSRRYAARLFAGRTPISPDEDAAHAAFDAIIGYAPVDA